MNRSEKNSNNLYHSDTFFDFETLSDNFVEA